MSPLGLRRLARRVRGSVVAYLCASVVAVAVVAHHAGLAEHRGMGGPAHGAAMVMFCLGVLGKAAVALATRPTLGRWLARRVRIADASPVRSVPAPRHVPLARDGPRRHLRLSVLQR